MSILIQNASALSPQGLLQRTSIAIEGARITRIAPALPARGVDTVIDAQGQLALPGLVNAHTHLAMVLLRGYAEGGVPPKALTTSREQLARFEGRPIRLTRKGS